MSLSLNEVESTVWKAARGAGLAWGLAEELGQAARWMADCGLDWAEPVVACLSEAERRQGRVPPPVLMGVVWQPAPGTAALNPVLCGPLISDLASRLIEDGGVVRFGPMAQPILLLPFVARAAETLHAGLTLSWQGADWLCHPLGIRGTSPAEVAVAPGIEVSVAGADHGLAGEPLHATGSARRTIAPVLLDRLEKWVRLTYVPASAESRRMGAGAGLTDND